jgi:GR25 family glycosyltransferase involved in LPS biosynthesis
MKESILKLLTNYNVCLENITNTSQSSVNIPIYVINMNKDVYRRAYINYICKKLNINFTLVVVREVTPEMREIAQTKVKNGVLGCYLSHLWCIKEAIKQQHPYFLVLEDDVVFKKDFVDKIRTFDYTKYDMVQLGCCDFNLQTNLQNSKNLEENDVYYPTKIALGAYGNIYNLNFAKVIFSSKINKILEFDTDFDEYYNRYKIAICYPNLITTELSTTNIQHNFSIFDKRGSNYFINSCFIDFSYSDYYFIWIKFIEECFYSYNSSNKMFTQLSYQEIIDKFSQKSNIPNDKIKDILENNDLNYIDINNVIHNILENKY